ncbi:unnamed protein product [Durusdinium trenchii]|uniref:Uncharacterized protein n=1 Tax=Durusdinium trenchii TaxID=1381693 RepID=A0ABP0MGJ4_9DINO
MASAALRRAAGRATRLCCGLSLLQLPLALVAVLPLPGPEFKRGQWSFRVLGLGLFGLSCCAYPLCALACLVVSESEEGTVSACERGACWTKDEMLSYRPEAIEEANLFNISFLGNWTK